MERIRDDITPLSKIGEYGYGGNTSFSQTGQPPMSTGYQPLNIHQNPYGHPPPHQNNGNTLPSMSIEELRSSRSGGSGGGLGPQSGYQPGIQPGLQPGLQPGIQHNSGLGPQSGYQPGISGPMFDPNTHDNYPQIPCRGVESDPTRFSHDAEIQPSYLPPTKLTTDYLKDFELETSKLAIDYQKNKHRSEHLENIWGEMQIPILLGVLFFLFQMPYWNLLMFRYFKFLGLFGEDGNMNIYGIFIKSVMFGISCYWVTLL